MNSAIHNTIRPRVTTTADTFRELTSARSSAPFVSTRSIPVTTHRTLRNTNHETLDDVGKLLPVLNDQVGNTLFLAVRADQDQSTTSKPSAS
jgi:hypothetical protein